jgi:periplasmic protein CpxP/Spy
MRNNGLKYLVALALFINAATLIFFWYNRPPEEGRRGGGAKQGRLLLEELKLDEKQQAIFQPMRVQHHQAHDSLLKLMAAQRQALYSQKQGKNDTIVHKIGLLQEEIERITYDHFKEVRKICTPAQQGQLDTLLGKTVQIILNNEGRRRPPVEGH